MTRWRSCSARTLSRREARRRASCARTKASPLSGLRFDFDLRPDSDGWAIYSLLFDELRVDLSIKEGVRFRARGEDVPFAQLHIDSSEFQGEGPRWRWALELDQTATDYELRFRRRAVYGLRDR